MATITQFAGIHLADDASSPRSVIFTSVS
jgi:hypothetical protein